LRNNAENSTAKIRDTHSDKIDGLSQELQQLRREAPLTDQMKLGFDQTNLHRGKILVKAEHINFAYQDRNIWKTFGYCCYQWRKDSDKWRKRIGKNNID
jgi:hypothetical protein